MNFCHGFWLFLVRCKLNSLYFKCISDHSIYFSLMSCIRYTLYGCLVLSVSNTSSEVYFFLNQSGRKQTWKDIHLLMSFFRSCLQSQLLGEKMLVLRLVQTILSLLLYEQLLQLVSFTNDGSWKLLFGKHKNNSLVFLFNRECKLCQI